jgi:hypothetical protein
MARISRIVRHQSTQPLPVAWPDARPRSPSCGPTAHPPSCALPRPASNSAAARTLDWRNTLALAQGQWLTAHEGLIITGRTGTIKSWLAFAFGRQAARFGHSVLYVRVPRMLEDLDGPFPRLTDKLTHVQLLLLDDFGTHALSDQQRFHIFETVQKAIKSTLNAAQVPAANWRYPIADSTAADAILENRAQCSRPYPPGREHATARRRSPRVNCRKR